MREHEAYKRLSVSPQEVKNALKKQLFSYFDTRLSTDTPPYRDIEWKWIRIVIAVCAMADAELPENYKSEHGHDNTTPLDVATRQNAKALVRLLSGKNTKAETSLP